MQTKSPYSAHQDKSNLSTSGPQQRVLFSKTNHPKEMDLEDQRFALEMQDLVSKCDSDPNIMQ